MPNNNIGLITKYAEEFYDEQYKAGSRSALLDGAEKFQVEWTGARTVRISKIQTEGLQDYTRPNDSVSYSGTGIPLGKGNTIGYQSSTVAAAWEDYTISMDRAAIYTVEKFDNEEMGGKLVGRTVKTVTKKEIIPEVDAFAFSKIAGYCSEALGNLVTINPTTNAGDGWQQKPLHQLNKALLFLEENEVDNEDQIIFCKPAFMLALRETGEYTKYMSQVDFDKSIKFTVSEYEDRKIVTVPPQRFRTAFSTKTSTGKGYTFGYWDASKNAAVQSKDILFEVVSKSAVIHIVKYKLEKVLEGDIVLAAFKIDGYAVFVRIYHDLFVLENKRYGLYTALDGAGTEMTDATANAPAATVETSTGINIDANTKVATTVPAGNKVPLKPAAGNGGNGGAGQGQ